MRHSIVWVDIPVANLERAAAFYTAVMNQEVVIKEGHGFRYALLPHYEENNQGNVSGLLMENPEFPPSANGMLVYVNVDGHLDHAVEAVRQNGGQVLHEKHPVGEHGFRVIVLDCEGNRIALHTESGN